MNKVFIVIFFYVSSLTSVIVTHNQSCQINLPDPLSILNVNALGKTFDGILRVPNLSSTSVQGSILTLSRGYVETDSARFYLNGTYDPTAGDTITLSGSHTLRGDRGVIPYPVLISGSGNIIEGYVLFGSTVTLNDSSSYVTLRASTPLNQSITLNGGTVTLGSDLWLTGDSFFAGSGNIIANKHRLVFPATTLSATSTLVFTQASSLCLRAECDLSARWTFTDGSTTHRIDGNGNVLDFTLGGSVIIAGGNVLVLNDVEVKGIGLGQLVFIDSTATLSLVRSSLQFSLSRTFTQGIFGVVGNGSQFIVRNNQITFSSAGKLFIDSGVLICETLDSFYQYNISPNLADGINLISLNGGMIRPSLEGTDIGNLTLDDASYQLVRPETFTATRQLIVRGANAATITIDGGGKEITFGKSTSAIVTVAANKNVVIKNAILDQFDPTLISLGSGATLTIGDATRVILATDSTLSYRILLSGDVLLDFNRYDLTLATAAALVLDSTTKLRMMHGRLLGLGNSSERLSMNGGASQLILEDIKIVLDGNYAFTQGVMSIVGDVAFTGSWQTFALTTTSPLTILSAATMGFDRGMTFSYDTRSALKTNLVFTDKSSKLSLCGATLHSTWTGVRVSYGTVLLDEHCTFSSQARNAGEALVIDSGATLRLCPGAALDLRGIVVYE